MMADASSSTVSSPATKVAIVLITITLAAFVNFLNKAYHARKAVHALKERGLVSENPIPGRLRYLS